MKSARSLFPGLAVAAALFAGGAAPASVPSGAPVFSDPLAIDNPWFPIRDRGVKVFRGREGTDQVTVLEQHLGETRVFDWQGTDVECRVVRESKFENGECTEMSRAFFAQADDGSVWYFGELAEPLPAVPDGTEPDDDPLDTESDGWVVGAVAPEDPEGTHPAPGPFLFMPADPELGDRWDPEALPGVVEETDLVVRAGVTLRVPAGRFRDCIAVRERTPFDDGSEVKWYAPGVGVVRQRGRGEALALQASTLLRR